MELEEAITGRRSVRSFTHAAVDPILIEQLIRAAVQAPSAMNRQPWVFTVVRNQADLLHISREAKRHLLATAEPSKESDQLHAMLNDANFNIFYHAPALIVISARETGAVGDRGLCSRGAKPYAESTCHGTWDVLDWFCAKLP